MESDSDKPPRWDEPPVEGENPEPEYTSIALPDPGEHPEAIVVSASSAEHKATPGRPPPAPDRPAPERRLAAPNGLLRRHPVWIAVLTVSILLILGSLVFAIGTWSRYSERALHFDMGTVNAVESGSIALDAEGRLLGQVALKDRRIVTLEEVPPHLIDALLATEDKRFRKHRGFDPLGTARAAVANLKAGEVVQGGSTISQQLARLAFDLSARRTLDRKLTELFLAFRIENEYTKDEILLAYLNRIYLGSGFWGVGAASQGYFGTHVSALSVSEAATLAALIKSPNRFSPFRDPEESGAARDRTLHRMSELGMISPERAAAIVQTPVEPLSELARGERPFYLLAAIRRETLSILGHRHRLEELEISTTVRIDLQDRAASAIERELRRLEDLPGYPRQAKLGFGEASESDLDYLQGAAVVVENGTGNILAAVAGRDFVDSKFDRVWQARRNPGTAITPFLYAAAFESGAIDPLSPVFDAPFDNRRVMIGGSTGVLGEWGAESLDNHYEGAVPAAYALARGKNGAAVRVGQAVGLESFGTFLADAGISSGLSGYPNSFLGQSPVNLLELVHAYTLFPNLGMRTRQTQLVTRIQDRDGKILYEAEEAGPTVSVMGAETASAINSILSKTFDIEPMRSRSSGANGESAGKAGTSYSFHDNWFIGYNADYTWGVWIGLDLPQPIYENAFGSETALPIWQSIASALQTEASLPTSFADSASVCLESGRKASEFCKYTAKGNLAVSLSGALARDSTEFCELHSAAHREEEVDESPQARIEPDLFSSFLPVQPKVDIVVGQDPWAATPAP